MDLLPSAPSAPPETPDETIRRLTAELREARDQQAATSEIVEIINRSGGDLAPVFDAMLEKTTSLCEAAHGNLWTYDGERFHPVATHGNQRYAEWLRQRGPVAPASGVVLERLVQGEDFIQIADALSDDLYRTSVYSREVIEITGARTALVLPLRKDNTLLGVIFAYRQEVRPFSDKQIALFKNFAAQAVIAMENARLLGELRERTQELTRRGAALRNSEERYALAMRAINEGVYEWDVASSEMYYSPRVCELVGLKTAELRTMTDWTDRIHPDDREEFKTAIIAHFRGETDRLDAEYRYRHADGSWHWARQHGIALKNEAGRAYRVVGSTGDITDRKAAEEALREALEQQTATANVLQVINSSPGDLAPVFDAILEKAHTLCGAAHGALMTFDGEYFRAVATRGHPEPFAELLRRGFPVYPGGPTEKLVHGERLIHIPDLATWNAGSPEAIAHAAPAVELGGTRTILMVPLRSDGPLLGCIAATRREVRPFTDKQIALLENFAAQAVIAMENARLLTETREALEQQTATAEVLQVINSSPGELAPVFDAILEKAHSLCGVEYGTLQLYDGEKFRILTRRGFPEDVGELWWREPYSIEPNSPLRALLRGEPLAEIPDVIAYHAEEPNPRSEAAIAVGIRSVLFLPLRRDNLLLGAISAGRKAAGRFRAKEIALLQNFAAQAVIAMENARLLTETREALEQQTATAEVLQVINSSPGDLAPVFDAILEKAHALCGAEIGSLTIYDGEENRAVATRGLAPSLADRLRQGFRPGPAHPIRKLLSGARIVQVADVGESADPIARASFELAGIRTSLYVPLRKDDRLLGQIVASRQEVRLFSDKEIALLQNFAEQAVIAMENARLIIETREALEQQTATAEVLQVINSSPGNLAPVFDAILEKAHTLCGAAHGALMTYDGEFFRAAALHDMAEPLASWLREPFRSAPGDARERLLQGERLFHIPDIAALEHRNPERQAALDAGVRTLLVVPLRKDGALLGYITANRREVRPFTDKQIALLQNFAAQAVIAMENARLITETREALEQQTATAEVLQVINSSPGDLAPVFDAMLEKATSLCEAAFGVLHIYDGERFHPVSTFGVPGAYADYLKRDPPEFGPGTGPARALAGERVVHVVNMADTEAYRAGEPNRRAIVDLGGARSALGVPLLKDEMVLGHFTIYRQQVRPFTEKQIALLQNFAVQAVIAIENARLLTETREALEQQTATAEVLQVINSSPGDLAPVFDAILEKALRLCSAAHGHVFRIEGHLGRAVAARGDPEFVTWLLRQGPVRPTPAGILYRMMGGESVVQIPDSTDTEAYRSGTAIREVIDRSGVRTTLAVALRNDNALLGAIFVNRREVRPFSDKEIALLQNFAAQAVIAMENAGY
jgi:PAS domain S-box-containing protein